MGSDDSEDSDFEKAESSAESAVSEELSESENDGKRRKTRLAAVVRSPRAGLD